MIISSQRRPVLIFIALITLLAAAVSGRLLWGLDRQAKSPVSSYSSTTVAAPSSTLATSSSPPFPGAPGSDVSTYRNRDFGFEFQYPDTAMVRENLYGSYYSKFNMDVAVRMGQSVDDVFLVNVVLPEFADKTFLRVQAKTSTVMVDEVPGIKYEYVFEEVPRISIVLPLGEYRAILATHSPNEELFYKILSTFNFIPRS